MYNILLCIYSSLIMERKRNLMIWKVPGFLKDHIEGYTPNKNTNSDLWGWKKKRKGKKKTKTFYCGKPLILWSLSITVESVMLTDIHLHWTLISSSQSGLSSLLLAVFSVPGSYISQKLNNAWRKLISTVKSRICLIRNIHWINVKEILSSGTNSKHFI